MHRRSWRANFGAELRRLRKSWGLTQRELASKLHVDPSYLSRIETGKTPPPRDFLERLIQAVPMTIDEQRGLALFLEPTTTVTLPFLDPVRLAEAFEPLILLLTSVFSQRLLRQLLVDSKEKHLIGDWLVEQFGPDHLSLKNFRLILDSGTTAAFVAHQLAKLSTIPFDVCTNNLLAAMYLVGKCPLYFLGGRLDYEFGATLSTESLLQLNKLLREKTSQFVGVLASLAFSAEEGPYARARDLPREPLSEEPQLSDDDLWRLLGDLPFFGSRTRPWSRHEAWKALMLGRCKYLIVPVTSEKLLRPRLPMWCPPQGPLLAAPAGEGHPWQNRIQNQDFWTHVILTLPDDELKRKQVLNTARTMQSQNFTLVTSLFGQAEGQTQRERKFLTMLDINNGVPLTST